MLSIEEMGEYPEDDREHLDGFCSVCGKEVTSVTVDIGIGPYEFWGTQGTHRELVEVSPCCEAEVMQEEFA